MECRKVETMLYLCVQMDHVQKQLLKYSLVQSTQGANKLHITNLEIFVNVRKVLFSTAVIEKYDECYLP